MRVCNFGTFCVHTVKAMRNCGHITYAVNWMYVQYVVTGGIMRRPLLVIPKHKTVPVRFEIIYEL